MKLTFLGAGSASTKLENFHSNMLLTSNTNQNMMIDCGSDARRALLNVGKTHRDIHAVYISHLHADHVGGMEWLGLSTKFDPICDNPTLFISDTLVETIWENTLSGGMRTIQEYHADLDTYFDVHTIPSKNQRFSWQHSEFQLVQTIHFYDFDQLQPCYGILFQVKDKTIYITSDTTFTPERLAPIYERADLIFHDCETSEYPSGVHSRFEELATLPEAIRRKTWLYHYDPRPLPDHSKHGFRGFVKPGQVFQLDDSSIF